MLWSRPTAMQCTMPEEEPGLGTLGGFLTASPVIANNIFSDGPVALPLAASYLISAASFSYTDVLAPIAAGTTYGAYIGIAGFVPLVGNADVAGLRVHLSDTAGVFGAGGQDLPQMVLAISRNGAGAGIGNYNIVTIGGAAGGNAVLILDNGATGAFRALAVDSQALAAPIPVGDVVSVLVTLTAYSDPASFSSIFPLDLDLLNLTGPLPDLALTGTQAATPEPATLGVLAAAALGLCGLRKRLSPTRRNRPRAALTLWCRLPTCGGLPNPPTKSGSQHRIQRDISVVKLRNRTPSLSPLRSLLESVLRNPRNLGFQLKVTLRNSKPPIPLFESDRTSRLQAFGRMPRIRQLLRKRHSETPRMRRRQQLFGVSALARLKPAMERVSDLRQSPGLRRNRARPRFQIPLPPRTRSPLHI